MKRAIYIFLMVMGFTSCRNNDEFTINGKLENAGSIRTIQLYRADELIDSAFLNENGEFKFTRSSPQPDFYTLVIGEKNFLVVGKNGDEVEFSADHAAANNDYTVKGSAESEKIKEFNSLGNKYSVVFQKLNDEFGALLSADPSARDSLEKVFIPRLQKNSDNFSDAALKFAGENKDNLAGFYAAGSVTDLKYEPQLIKYAEGIKSKYPGNKAVEAFVNRMMDLKTVSVGQKAPDFELATPEGRRVKLSDFRGKYVLLDFWASWCGPCRAQNPDIVKNYNTFKNRNFTVLGVSLDKDKSAWIKAIKDDNLAWTHVSELKEWSGDIPGLYKFDAIPASFIIDPEGNIIAKNLSGEQLGSFLNDQLKNNTY